MPTEEAVKLNEMMLATRTPTGQYVVDCARIPELPIMTLTFGGEPFELRPEGN
jgi:saccharopepsin